MGEGAPFRRLTMAVRIEMMVLKLAKMNAMMEAMFNLAGEPIGLFHLE